MGEDFKKGDFVMLKSGGPVMRIDHVKKNNWLKCSWYNNGKKATAVFKPETLIGVVFSVLDSH